MPTASVVAVHPQKCLNKAYLGSSVNGSFTRDRRPQHPRHGHSVSAWNQDRKTLPIMIEPRRDKSLCFIVLRELWRSVRLHYWVGRTN